MFEDSVIALESFNKLNVEIRKIHGQKTTQGPQQFIKALHMKDQDALSASRSITIGRIPNEDNSASEINLNVPEGYSKYNGAGELKKRIIESDCWTWQNKSF